MTSILPWTHIKKLLYFFNQPLIMTAITIDVLKRIMEHIPEDYTVEFDNGKNTYSIDDKVEIDVVWGN